MSLVGPRPLRPFEASALCPWQLARQDLRPGLTGLWQVLGRSNVDWDERMQLDYDYVSHWSFASDLRILARTLPAVLEEGGCRLRRRARWLALAASAIAGPRRPSRRPANAAIVVPDGGFVIQGSTADVVRGIDVAHDAGARWISLPVSWESLEPQPDSYRTPGGAGTDAWDELGTRLAYAKSRGMSVEVRLSNAPGWASGRAGVSDDPPTPANLAAYGDFLTDLASRFGNAIDAYSPWNEPNRTAFWNPPDPDAFTALQKAAYPAIKAVDPSATVLYGPVVGRYASQNTRLHVPAALVPARPEGLRRRDRLERIPGRRAGVCRAHRGRRAGGKHAARPALPARPHRPVRPRPQGLDHGDELEHLLALQRVGRQRGQRGAAGRLPHPGVHATGAAISPG